MSENKEKGEEGEKIAAEYLTDKGFVMIKKNWRFHYSEVDIIAKDGNDLVFVEVKLRTYDTFGYPESFVTNHKMKKLAEAADGYRQLFSYEGELRFDVISIIKNQYKTEIEHFKDAFYPRG
jgi:putative endonuclease